MLTRREALCSLLALPFLATLQASSRPEDEVQALTERPFYIWKNGYYLPARMKDLKVGDSFKIERTDVGEGFSYHVADSAPYFQDDTWCVVIKTIS